MELPLISIIVPVYNAEKYLIKCIQSLLCQTYKNLEILLIDDGSTDGSALICDNYAKSDSRIRVYHTVNKGQAAARNLGIQNARGLYIGFVDSDDWVDLTMYEILYTQLIQTHADMIACNYYVMNQDGFFSIHSEVTGIKTLTNVEAMAEVYSNNLISYSPCNKLYAIQLFDDNLFKEGIIFEDMDISYRLVSKCKKVTYIDQGLYFYCYNSSSTLRGDFSPRLLDVLQVSNGMYDFYKKYYPNIAVNVYMKIVHDRFFLYYASRARGKSIEQKFRELVNFDRSIIPIILATKTIPVKQKLKYYFIISKPTLSAVIYDILGNHKKVL